MINPKKCILISLFFYKILSVFCFTGLMSEQKELKYFKTQYFDIIFPATCSEYATQIAENADKIYLEICDEYKTTPKLHIPVTITPECQIYNAYASQVLQNHIVLFDSLPDQSLMVLKHEDLDVFRHELTHIITSNLSNDTTAFMQNLYTDGLTMGALKITPMINEGASVASESRGGYGRLNDGFFLHQIRQLKIQNQLPSWEDSMGNHDDNFYNGIMYSMGAPFIEYLQNTYGMTKYVEFNYSLVNDHSPYINTSAKKVYGKTMTELWNEFTQSIQTFEINQNPLDEEFIYDYFNQSNYNKKLNIKNRNGSLYNNLYQNKHHIIYKDKNSSTTYIINKNDGENIPKSQKLIDITGKATLTINNSSRYITINKYDVNHPGIKKTVWIYDTKTKKTFKTKLDGVSDPIIIEKNDGLYICAVKFDDQKVYLNYYKLDITEKGNIKNLSLSQSIKLPKDSLIYSLNAYGTTDQKVACIYVKDVKYSIRIYDGEEYTEYSLPEDFHIRDLSYNYEDNSLAFSYCLKNTLPRLAIIEDNETSATLLTLDKDISGGIYTPIITGSKVLYTGHFVDNAKLLVLDLSKVQLTQQSISKVISVQQKESEFTSDLLLSAKNYNPNLNATVIPGVAYNPTVDLTNHQTNIDFTLAGGSIVFTTPWDSAYTFLAAGWNPVGNYGEFGQTYLSTSGSWGMPLSIFESYNTIFDNDGFRQFANQLSIKNTIHLGKHSTISFEEHNTFFIGKQVSLKEDSSNFLNLFNYSIYNLLEDNTNYYFDQNIIKLRFKTGTSGEGYRENFDWWIKLSYENGIVGSIGEVSKLNAFGYEEGNVIHPTYFHNLYPSVGFDLPKLIPIDCINGFSYNFPVSVSFNITPDRYKLFSSNTNITLFEIDIQKGLKGFLPIYFYRFSLDFDYIFSIYHQNNSFALSSIFSELENNFSDISEQDFTDSYQLKLNLELGTYATMVANSNLKMLIFSGIEYTNRGKTYADKPISDHVFKPIFGISSSLAL